MPQPEPRAATDPGCLSPAQPRVDAIQRRTMTVLVIAQVIGTVGVGVAPTIGVLLAGAVTHSEAWAGLAHTGSTLGAALVGLPLGNLAARRGRRVALTTGWRTAATGGALLAAAFASAPLLATTNFSVLSLLAAVALGPLVAVLANRTHTRLPPVDPRIG